LLFEALELVAVLLRSGAKNGTGIARRLAHERGALSKASDV
jgi:hypothetical protein